MCSCSLPVSADLNSVRLLQPVQHKNNIKTEQQVSVLNFKAPQYVTSLEFEKGCVHLMAVCLAVPIADVLYPVSGLV
jgi:hypothetical protein